MSSNGGNAGQLPLWDAPVIVTVGPLNSSQEGTWKEDVVKADLQRRGFHLFHHICHASPFDHLAYCEMEDGNRLQIRIETKSPTTQRDVDWNRCDLLAVVNNDEDIRYFVWNTLTGSKQEIDPSEWALWLLEYVGTIEHLSGQSLMVLEEHDKCIEEMQQTLQKMFLELVHYIELLEDAIDIPEELRFGVEKEEVMKLLGHWKETYDTQGWRKLTAETALYIRRRWRGGSI